MGADEILGVASLSAKFFLDGFSNALKPWESVEHMSNLSHSLFTEYLWGF